MTLTAGLAPEDLDERLREARRLSDVGNRALAFYLADMDERGVARALGMPSAVSYARLVLGLSRRRARQLIAAGRALESLPAIDESFRENRINWSRVRVIARVATPETEAAWLDCALRSTQEELEARTALARPGDLPRDLDGLPKPRFVLRFVLDSVQHAMWENARAKLRAELGHGADVSDEELLCEMVELLLRTEADGTSPGRKAIDGSPFKIVVAKQEDSGTGVVVTEDGNEAIDEAMVAQLESDAVTPPRLREKVFAREGHRCANCGSGRNLHAHHVVWRTRGGPTKLGNLVALCSACHGLVHHGLLNVEVAHGATRPEFVFRDPHGRIVRRRVSLGPRVELEGVPHGATRDAGEDANRRRWSAGPLALDTGSDVG